MQTIEELRNLLDYNEWANRRIIASLKASSTLPSAAVRALTHLLIAEKTWLIRLREEPGYDRVRLLARRVIRGVRNPGGRDISILRRVF